jgi:hypothetical protein
LSPASERDQKESGLFPDRRYRRGEAGQRAGRTVTVPFGISKGFKLRMIAIGKTIIFTVFEYINSKIT